MTPTKRKRPDILGALDIGSSKITCYIARLNEDGQMEILGVGQQLSQGIKNGCVENMDEAENAILRAVHSAEQMAACTLHDVFVNFSCGAPRSRIVWDEISVKGGVDVQDVERLLHKVRENLGAEGQEILHAIPLDYAIDPHNHGTSGIRDPLGMVGSTLGVRVHLLSGTTSPIQNWRTCIARCHLQIQH
jgi:cell division protein FtsA